MVDEAIAAGPKGFFETFAQFESDERFAPFSDEELLHLEWFDEAARELRQRPFFLQRQTMSVKVSPEESYERFEHAGDDALRSMSMTFRLFWLQREPTRFQRIRNMLRSHTSDDVAGRNATVLLDELGRRYKVAGREPLLSEVCLDRVPIRQPELWGPTELRTMHTVRQHVAVDVIDAWFYSGRFHNQEERRAFVRRWGGPGFEYQFAKAVGRHASLVWLLNVAVQSILAEQRTLA